MPQSVLWAAAGTGFTWLMTSLGAAIVFFFRSTIKENVQRIFLGFAAGVMIAASVWSLLIPAIEEAESAGQIGWIPAAGGADDDAGNLRVELPQDNGLSAAGPSAPAGHHRRLLVLALGGLPAPAGTVLLLDGGAARGLIQMENFFFR